MLYLDFTSKCPMQEVTFYADSKWIYYGRPYIDFLWMLYECYDVVMSLTLYGHHMGIRSLCVVIKMSNLSH